MTSLLSGLLSPIGGLAICACCLIIIAIWGLFASMIALAIYTRRWAYAIREANDLYDRANQIYISYALLILILCIYLFFPIRTSIHFNN
ncbi:unnamed protein product [Rotaria sp. Silwood1]|nr:unnamed protein product [Rotaria sp. Silwood1]CAF1634703.1 unnamed protein product [Rotaria sp. Silwood1]CAF3879164.1 unnamed protein product [Rotaria sp. Silwood1]CAF5007053.1 unnamed protein product [Rotaria sp. Silwood1]